MKLQKAFTLSIVIMFVAVSMFSCVQPSQNQAQTATGSKDIELTIRDIRGQSITYDFYQVRGADEMEYVSTEVADRDGNTIVALEIDQDINSLIVKRTKNGVEKRQVVPIRNKKMVVQFLL